MRRSWRYRGRRARQRTTRRRWLVAAIGALLIAVALGADRLGLDSDPSFGTGETLLLVTGLGLIGVAILGRRTADARRTTAVFLFDAVILLALVELALIGLSTWSSATWRIDDAETGLVDRLTETYLDLPYYRSQPWSATYWQENSEAGARHYQPFVTWRRGPYNGSTVTVDERGFRAVPGARCDAPDAFRVDTLGGSTMWGWGAHDEGTIAAYLQRGLEDRLKRPVCVRNLGETAFVSTQELVQWMLVLRDDQAAGRPRPDLAIFYDGVNDTFAAHQAGRAGAHQNLAQVAGRLETPTRPLASVLGRLNIVRWGHRLIASLTSSPPPDPTAAPPEGLEQEVIDTYLGVVDAADHLAGTTRAVFFWQPMLGVGHKPLTAVEQALLDGALDWAQDPNPAPIDFVRRVYARASQIDDPRVIDLTDAFDDTSEAVWIDPWGHVTPVGNAIIARRMLVALDRMGALAPQPTAPTPGADTGGADVDG